MNEDPYTVAIVVDTAFGLRLSAVTQRMPVWVVDTPINRVAAEQHWRDSPEQSHTEGVTVFKVDADGTPEQWCADILETVDVHHDEYSHEPAYSAVEVFGASLSEELRAAFVDFGFTEFTERPDGFRASIPAAVEQRHPTATTAREG